MGLFVVGDTPKAAAFLVPFELHNLEEMHSDHWASAPITGFPGPSSHSTMRVFDLQARWDSGGGIWKTEDLVPVQNRKSCPQKENRLSDS